MSAEIHRSIVIGGLYTLNKDNIFKHVVWSKKGEKVTVISISGNAVIYEDKKGKRFPCNIKDID